MRYWLMKSEPDEFSIDDLARAKNRTTSWFGVRNYQARNYMRDEMHVGDHAFFYHSSCPEPGIAGLVTISAPAHPDRTQFDATSPYYDPKATRAAPRWVNVDVTFVEKTRLVPLAELRGQKALAGMLLLRPGNRLSITPVTAAEWNAIVKLARAAAPAPPAAAAPTTVATRRKAKKAARP
ncbi:MAG: EVE domain-containing protein [Proteobacteria bacterium]|nr:EVE domain-containing protein [Pseudomonadota bacterium]